MPASPSPPAAAAPARPPARRSLIASAALRQVAVASAARSARIFSVMFSRYSGSLAASETACLPASDARRRRSRENARSTIEQRRRHAPEPALQAPHRRGEQEAEQDRQRERDQHLACARYSTAVTTTSSAQERRAGLHFRRARSSSSERPVTSYGVADGEPACPPAGPACWCRRAGAHSPPPLAPGRRELHHVLPAVEDDQQRRLVAALLDAARLRAAVEQHAEAARVADRSTRPRSSPRRWC